MSEYKSFRKRIDSAHSLEAAERLAGSLQRLFAAGIFNESQFKRLDGHLCDRVSRLRGWL